MVGRILGCRVGTFPINYLGVPIRLVKVKRMDWNVLIEKLYKRLEGWKCKLLSIGRRIIMLNASLLVTPIYMMSMFKLPTWVRYKIR